LYSIVTIIRSCILPISAGLKFVNAPGFTFSGPSGGTANTYRPPLVGYTVKTNTTDMQTVDSEYSNAIHQEILEERETKVATNELRNVFVKLN